MTGAEALAAAQRRLSAAGIEGAGRDARRLLAHALGIAPDRVTLVAPEKMTARAVPPPQAAIAARAARRPPSPPVGGRALFRNWLVVTPATLAPTLRVDAPGQAGAVRPLLTEAASRHQFEVDTGHHLGVA